MPPPPVEEGVAPPRRRRSTTPPPSAVDEVSAPVASAAPEQPLFTDIDATDKSAIAVSIAPKSAAKAPARKRAPKEPAAPVSVAAAVDNTHEHHFFAGPAAPGDSVPPSHDAGFDGDATQRQKMSPEAHARRAELAKYVKIVVGVLVVLLVVAILRRTMSSTSDKNETPSPVPSAVSSAALPSEVKPPDVIVPAPVPTVESPSVEAGLAGAEDAGAASGDAGGAAGSDALPPLNVVGVTGDGTTKPKTAGQEKAASKAALEGGNFAAAIAAGERAVALDPSDGEAWLVLGGAYQGKGNVPQARRCYEACIHRGKRGPIGECGDLLKGLSP